MFNNHYLGPRTIWILGSSIVKHAFCYARKSQYGANLELDRHNATIFWQGKGGMRVEEICSKVRTLLKVQNAPHMLVIHCGGNNIPASKGAQIGDRHAKSADLRDKLKTVIEKLIQLLPSTIIIWSQILPRLHWRGGINQPAMERTRMRVNSYVATLLIGLWGKYIRYPELHKANTGMFCKDKVHLSGMGNDMFLYRLQQALQAFLNDSSVKVSPRVGQNGPWLRYD